MSKNNFDYNEAFNRNIGLLTKDEQERLKKFIIVIPGMGGVGGAYLISLVRQGFENFRIADLDSYELKNFNRQYGADLNSLDKKKATVMKKKALEINPNCKIEVFPKGINEGNLNQFLAGVDLAVDGLDFFEVEVRRKFFNKAHQLGIPLITAGPIGFGTAVLIFTKDSPNFDKYFGVKESTPYYQKLLAFVIGLAPSMLQMKYMKNTSLKEKRGPSSIGAVNLCSGFVVVNAIKLLLGIGKVYPVPYYQQFDVMRNKYVLKKLHLPGKNPLQKLKLKIALKMLENK